MTAFSVSYASPRLAVLGYSFALAGGSVHAGEKHSIRSARTLESD